MGKQNAARNPELRTFLDRRKVRGFVDRLFHEDLHAKRIGALADGALGILHAGAVGIHAIGRGLAAAAGLVDKHAIKQVDRLIGNEAIDVWDLFATWVPYAIGKRRAVMINLDWTEFDGDNHSTLVLSLQTKHGRSTPLMWLTVYKSKLKNRRNNYEDDLLVRLREVVPDGVKVTIVADRGFADHKLFEFLSEALKFEYVIRFRSVVYVTDENGKTRKAIKWLGKSGRMRVLRNANITARSHPVATVVVVQEKGMKDAWCIAASDPSYRGAELKKMYGKRFSCEETFRDIKDLHYGLGMSWQPIRKPERRDRMFLLAALACVLLTMLGEAGEQTGLDRLLKANTSKSRTLSLFRQGLRWYELIPTMKKDRLKILITQFHRVMREHTMCREVLGVL